MQTHDACSVCSSMQPALNPQHQGRADRVLTDKLSVKLYSYRRGDVVTLWWVRLPGCGKSWTAS